MQALEEGSVLFLRSLLSPLRLLSAAMWHLIQQEAVTHYGMLEEVVSLITDTLPDLLSYRQKTQLTMGLRARLVLELCGMETLTDTNTLQTHLQRIETLVALHKELESGDALVEESGANFVALVQILMKDPAERNTFFKDVYPLQYGVKFSKALQKLMWLFLSRLEKALPQPTMEEAAHLLCTAPTVMEECIQSLSQPQQLRNVLVYQKEASVEMKETTPLSSTVPDDCILSCLGSPRLVQILIGEQTLLDTQSESVLDYIPSYCQEIQMESVVITQYIENEVETSISEVNDDGIQYDAQETKECIDTKYSTEVAYEEIKSLDLQTVDVDLDEKSEKQDPVEVSIMDMEAVDGGEESIAHQEEKGLVKNETETAEKIRLYMIKQPCVKLDRLDLSVLQFSKNFNPKPSKRDRGQPKKDPQNQPLCRKKHEKKTVTVPHVSINKPKGLTNGISGIVPKLKKTYTVVKVTSGEYACSLCSFQDAEEIKLHHHIIVHHPEEYKQLCVAEEGTDPQDVVSTENQNSPVNKVRSYRGVPVCKTCPTCDKTFTRSSDMRRHQVCHTVDRPFLCHNCGKSFRYTFDLRRHQQRVCVHKDYVVVYRRRGDVTEDVSVEIKADGSGALHQDLSQIPVKSNEKAECLSSDSVRLHAGSGIQPRSLISVEKLAVSEVSEPTLGSFPDNLHSRRHLRSPSSNHPHKCSQCGESFKYSYNLKKHEDVCEGKGRRTGSDQCHSKDHELDTSELGISVSADPSLQETLCLDEQEQQRNAAQSTKSDLYLTCSRCEKKCKDTCTHKQICASSERCFKCVKCDALFKSVLDIQKHVHIHWGEDPLQCSRCGKHCLTPSELTRHALAHTKESRLPCTLCSETFEQLYTLRKHYLTVHDFKGPYQCPKCHKTQTDLKGIVKHMKTHSKERPYQCSHCTKSFKQRSALTVHVKIHSGDKPFLCEACGKCFISNISLQRHAVSHKTERPYTCPQCKNRFKTHNALHSHLLRHTPGASIPCEFCGKMFLRASALHRHRRTHTGERPYSCPKCEKRFLSKGEVAKHMRYHTGERPFRCSHCSKTFTQTCYLSVHMRIHTGERPYKCGICKSAFVCNTHLKRHMFVHTQERPHKCDCGKSFNQAHPLKVHQRSQCLLRKKQL